MKKDKELELMWKITRLINKTHCHGLLRIHRIFFYNKRGNEMFGFYKKLANGKKVIGIYSKSDKITRIRILIHELAHAYMDQMLDLNCRKELSELIRRHTLDKDERECLKEMITHDKEFKDIMKSFIKTVDKNLDVRLKRYTYPR